LADKFLRDRWALASGVGIAFLTFVLAFFLIDVCPTVYSLTVRGAQYDQSVLDRLARIMEAWGSPILYLFLTIGATAWMARRLGARDLGHGVLVGVIAAASWSVLESTFDLPQVRELIVYPLLGMVGGLSGCFLGRISLAGREALYRASRDVGHRGVLTTSPRPSVSIPPTWSTSLSGLSAQRWATSP